MWITSYILVKIQWESESLDDAWYCLYRVPQKFEARVYKVTKCFKKLTSEQKIIWNFIPNHESCVYFKTEKKLGKCYENWAVLAITSTNWIRNKHTIFNLEYDAISAIKISKKHPWAKFKTYILWIHLFLHSDKGNNGRGNYCENLIVYNKRR